MRLADRKKNKFSIHLFIIFSVIFIFFHLSSANAQTGSISGTVSKSDFSNPGGIMIFATPLSSSVSPPASAITDEYGKYTIMGLAAGKYYVKANPSNQNFIGEYYNDVLYFSDASAVTVVAGGDTPDINFQLNQGGSITGKVTDSSGAGIADVWIHAFSNACLGEHLNSASTDASGTYTIMGLPAGFVYLRTINHPFNKVSYITETYNNAASCEEAYPVPVNIGMTEKDINFQLELAGSVSGTIHERDGITPVAGIRVNVYSDPCQGILKAATYTDDSGGYSLMGLPAGNIYVKALSESAESLPPWISPTHCLRGWYYNALSCEEADSVKITAGVDTGDINLMLYDDTDTDGDRMPDQWEISYFESLTRNGAGDYDSDGISDLQEYENGSVPKDIDNDISGDNDGGGGGGCFIATAAYGSPQESHVMTLREFRDRFLLNHRLGKVFVSLYYKYSPPIAAYITKHDTIRMFVRWSLSPLVWLSQFILLPGHTIAIFIVSLFCFFMIASVSIKTIRRIVR
jgi:hypothetical protein